MKKAEKTKDIKSQLDFQQKWAGEECTDTDTTVALSLGQYVGNISLSLSLSLYRVGPLCLLQFTLIAFECTCVYKGALTHYLHIV